MTKILLSFIILIFFISGVSADDKNKISISLDPSNSSLSDLEPPTTDYTTETLPHTKIYNSNLSIKGGSNNVNYSYISVNTFFNKGKYYWEVQVEDLAEIDQVGVLLSKNSMKDISTSVGLAGTFYGGRGIQLSNGRKVGNNLQLDHMGKFINNDILMIALDLDNRTISFGRNGKWSDGLGNANKNYKDSTPAFTDLQKNQSYAVVHVMRDSDNDNIGISHYNFGDGFFGKKKIINPWLINGAKFKYEVPMNFNYFKIL